MSPANPRYVGRGDNVCGGEVVYTIPEMKDLLRGHSEDAQRWLTTSQMGGALTRERNELTNERDERDGKPVARQLAPMICKFIREQCEMQDFKTLRTTGDRYSRRQRNLTTYGVYGRRSLSQSAMRQGGTSKQP